MISPIQMMMTKKKPKSKGSQDPEWNFNETLKPAVKKGQPPQVSPKQANTTTTTTTTSTQNVPGTSTTQSNDATTSGQPVQRPSALTSVIYPVLGKLLKATKDQQAIATLAQLKIAFDNAEKSQPGVSQQIIVGIIETLKK